MNQPLANLFGQLNKTGVKYFLLTDFECDLVSNDLDLFVHPDHRNAFENTLLTGGWYKRKEPTHHLNHHFYYSPNSEIYLDVKYDLTFAGGKNKCFQYLNTDEALANATLNDKGVYRPYGLDAVVLYASHLGYKERGRLEEKHKHYLNLFMYKYREEVHERSLGILAEIQNWLLNGFPSNIYRLQDILSPFFKAEKRKMVRNKRYLKFGYGMKVLFLGTDGAGKTTLIESVENRMNLKTTKLYLGMGENGWTSPVVKKIYHYKFKDKLLNNLLSFLKSFVVLPIEFMFRIVPVKLRSRYSVVLIDRLPGSVFLENNIGKKGIYKTILPKPDLVFFLYADPEVIVQRKPNETNLERSKADIIKFQRVAEIVSEGTYIGIDTSKLTIHDASNLIISEIYKNAKVYNNLFTASVN